MSISEMTDDGRAIGDRLDIRAMVVRLFLRMRETVTTGPARIRRKLRLWRMTRGLRRHPPAPAFVNPGIYRGRLYWVSGEPDFAGRVYRVDRLVDAVGIVGYDAAALRLGDVLARPEAVADGRLVVFWRCGWSPELQALILALKKRGTVVVGDYDDLMFDPKLARGDVIEGIRQQGLEAADVCQWFAGCRSVVALCDAMIAATDVLAEQLRGLGKPTFLVPNTFSDQARAASRRAVSGRCSSEDVFRIGYAAGSHTHQQDFRVVAPALASVLRRAPQARLVLFSERVDGICRPTVDLDEFPEFEALRSQVEWRPMVPMSELSEELARYNVNIIPLEVGNPFCEAKSELKYFEAALCEVPTVASPTVPLARAIRHGVTGFLAATTEAWIEALDALLADPATARRVGNAAFHDVEDRFGPPAAQRTLDYALVSLLGDDRHRSQLFRSEHCVASPVPPVPHRVPHRLVFERHKPSVVTDAAVVIPVYNYRDFVGEAVASVRRQVGVAVELVVVDDGSTDDSLERVLDAVNEDPGALASVTVVSHLENTGLAMARNTGFWLSHAPHVLPLDADNSLDRHCLVRLVSAVRASGAAAGHPSLRRFGRSTPLLEADTLHPATPWRPEHLRLGNQIDAMALISRAAWWSLGGFERTEPPGWEDYMFWCRMIEAGLWSVAVPDAVANYRVHAASMLHTQTMRPAPHRRLQEDALGRHPWLRLKPAPFSATGGDVER